MLWPIIILENNILEKPGKMQLRISIPNTKIYVTVPAKQSEFCINWRNNIAELQQFDRYAQALQTNSHQTIET
jgi:hypothetical protein